jgi:hypothetical protein
MGIDGSVWIDDAWQEIVAGLSVAHGLLGWGLTWDTPGVFVGASADLATHETVESLLENESWEGCYEYEDAHYLGAYNRYVVCGRVVGLDRARRPAQGPARWTSYQILSL